MNRRDYLLGATSGLALLATTGAQAAFAAVADGGGDAKPPYVPQMKFGLRIPMRDGVHLSATLYLPRGMRAPKPVILSLTPYTADNSHMWGVSFAAYGSPFLAVDMRGRGESEGEFAPFASEPDDAHDIVEWAAGQPWCNGKVAMYGISWVGYTQWGAVRGAPPHLATIVPSSPAYAGYDFPIRFNIFFNFAAQWLTNVSGHTLRLRESGDGEFWYQQFLGFLESGLPFRKMTEYLGLESKPFDLWMQHPHQDDFYDRADPTPEQLANLTMPVLSICGVYDGDQLGTIEFHRQHHKLAGGKADHYLVIGPWGHTEVRKPVAEFLGIKVGQASVIDMMKLHRDWYGFAMEGGQRPDFLRKKVAYYVMVADTWRYADTLEGVTARYQPLHLHSSQNADSVYRAGALSPKPPVKSAPDHYVYDPRDLRRPRLEATLTETYLTDQSLMHSDFGDQLIYQTEPFEADTEVSGIFKFNASIAIDQPDTQFMVSIWDIAPDGTGLFMTEQQQRARHREGLRTEKLIRTKEPLRYDFDRFFFVSRTIRKGHRLRLVLDPNHNLKWQKNYNSGKPVADETMADARTVTVRLFHDPVHPSILHVPIGQPEV